MPESEIEENAEETPKKRRKRKRYSVERDLFLIELLVENTKTPISEEEFLKKAFEGEIPKSYGSRSVLSRCRTLVKKVKQLTEEDLNLPEKEKKPTRTELLESAIKDRFGK